MVVTTSPIVFVIFCVVVSFGETCVGFLPLVVLLLLTISLFFAALLNFHVLLRVGSLDLRLLEPLLGLGDVGVRLVESGLVLVHLELVLVYVRVVALERVFVLQLRIVVLLVRLVLRHFLLVEVVPGVLLVPDGLGVLFHGLGVAALGGVLALQGVVVLLLGLEIHLIVDGFPVFEVFLVGFIDLVDGVKRLLRRAAELSDDTGGVAYLAGVGANVDVFSLLLLGEGGRRSHGERHGRKTCRHGTAYELDAFHRHLLPLSPSACQGSRPLIDILPEPRWLS